MVGQPIIRSQVAKIQALGTEGQETILEMFARGDGIAAIRAFCGVGNRAFYEWLENAPGMKAAWNEAKKYRAQALADAAMEDAEAPAGRDATGVPLTFLPEHVAQAALKVKVKQWLAAVNDPQNFGKSPTAMLTINHMHLEAVEAINAEDTARRMKVLDAPTEPLPVEILPAGAPDESADPVDSEDAAIAALL